MSHDPETRQFHVGGVPVSATSMPGLVDALDRQLGEGPDAPGSFVVFRDAHGIVRAQTDPRLRAAHEAALLVCPDGRPLAWIGRLQGFDEIRQVPGIESVEVLCRAGVGRGWTHYFLGGGSGVAAQLAAEMNARVPGLTVVGVETPPFREPSPEEVEAMRERIIASGASLVWVGLGTPKQELWMAENAPHLPGTVSLGVGAAFDVNIGRIPRAPLMLQKVGLEWLYRLAREPRRLWRRYAQVVPRFLALTVRDFMGRKGPQEP